MYPASINVKIRGENIVVPRDSYTRDTNVNISRGERITATAAERESLWRVGRKTLANPFQPINSQKRKHFSIENNYGELLLSIQSK